jgi:hypothetical protein
MHPTSSTYDNGIIFFLGANCINQLEEILVSFTLSESYLLVHMFFHLHK